MKSLISLMALGLTFALAGCDVSDGPGGSNPDTGNPGDGGGDNQAGDPVVVDFPIAYVERPAPYEPEDPDNEDSPQVLVPFDVFDPTQFNPGARIVVKDRASVSAAARVITSGIFLPVEEGGDAPLYDVKDLTVNADGTKLAFAMRAPQIEDADEDEQPTWNIWEYDITTDTVTRVISSDIQAEAGQDIMPAYLPDDSLVFSSTRQRISKSISLDQSRPQFSYVTERDNDDYAFTLHVIDANRENLTQISFGLGNDFYPTVLADGRILFLRGDDTSNTNSDRLSLYTMHPDGSNLSPYYGYHSPSSQDIEGQGMLMKPMQMSDGRIMVSYRERVTNTYGGDIVAIDAQNYIDLTQPTYANVGAEGPAETSLSFGEVVIDGQSPHGIFNSAYPLFDGTGRFIVAWQPCLVQGYNFANRIYTQTQTDDEGNESYVLINANGELVDTSGNVLAEGTAAVVVEADEVISMPCITETFDNPFIELVDPQFGVWVYDPVTQTQAPVVPANAIGTLYSEAVVFEARTPPNHIPGPSGDPDRELLVDENVGVINIKSIFSVDGEDGTGVGISALADPAQTPTDQRPVRFIRILEHAKMPHDDDYDIDMALVRGRNGQPGKGVIGYAQVHPDGSAVFKVPANVAFTMEWVDANGRRLTGGLSGNHRNWINVVPGEIRTCNGCHTANSNVPHGRADAEPPSANIGALAPSPFPNTRLLDPNGTPYSAMPEVGETMAEYFTRVKLSDPAVDADPRDLSLDIVFTDEWTDPNVATPGADISLVFASPEAAGPDNLRTLPPVLIGDCLEEWSFLCRTVIDYPDHIQPIFEVPRTINVMGADVNVTCTNCHSSVDPEGNQQIPEPSNTIQLSFENIVSPLDNNMVFLRGYDELFAAGDPVLEVDPETGQIRIQQIPVVIDGEIQYQMTQLLDENGVPLFEAVDQTTLEDLCVPQSTTDPNIVLNVDANGANIPCMTFVYYTDENGDLVLDGAGNPIPVPIFENNLQGRYLNVAQGANSQQNNRFFAVFEPGAPHAGYLSPAELKLISEYLDVGGQYYNEIFKALDD